jgi:hypothetical protein
MKLKVHKRYRTRREYFDAPSERYRILYVGICGRETAIREEITKDRAAVTCENCRHILNGKGA